MGALPLGLETVCEILGVETLKPLDLSPENLPKLMETLSEPFPMGMKVLNIEPLTYKLSSRCPKSMTYSFKPEVLPEGLVEKFQSKTLPIVLNHRGHEVNLNAHILDLQICDGRIFMRVKCNEQGGTASPYPLFGGLMGVKTATATVDDVTRQYLIRKESMEFED